MPAAADTKAALATAATSLEAALAAVAAARALWLRDAATDSRMGTTFPVAARFPTDPPSAAAEVAWVRAAAGD